TCFLTLTIFIIAPWLGAISLFRNALEAFDSALSMAFAADFFAASPATEVCNAIWMLIDVEWNHPALGGGLSEL
ncbi:unnamed protein product, partial [Effrenium voratum]